MTVVDNLIAIKGSSLGIYSKSEGAIGVYGDPVETWTLLATEIIWIQERARTRGAVLVRDAGKIDESKFVGFFLSTSVVVDGSYVLKGTQKYDVEMVRAREVGGVTSHIMADLRLREEG